MHTFDVPKHRNPCTKGVLCVTLCGLCVCVCVVCVGGEGQISHRVYYVLV